MPNFSKVVNKLQKEKKRNRLIKPFNYWTGPTAHSPWIFRLSRTSSKEWKSSLSGGKQSQNRNLGEEMAAKTLIRSGASLMNRFLSKPAANLVRNNLRPFQQIAPQGPELPPYFPPSFSNLQSSSLPSPPNDTVTLRELTERGFLHPSGLPSLEFFLPEGTSVSLTFI